MNENQPGDYVLSWRTVHMACTWMCVEYIAVWADILFFLSRHTVSWLISDVLHMSWFQLPILQKHQRSTIFKCIPHSPTHIWNNRFRAELWACKSATLTCCAGCHDNNAAINVGPFITYSGFSFKLITRVTSVKPNGCCFTEELHLHLDYSIARHLLTQQRFNAWTYVSFLWWNFFCPRCRLLFGELNTHLK